MVGRANARGATVHGGGAERHAAPHRLAEEQWRPLPDDIAKEGEEEEEEEEGREGEEGGGKEEEKGRKGEERGEIEGQGEGGGARVELSAFSPVAASGFFIHGLVFPILRLSHDLEGSGKGSFFENVDKGVGKNENGSRIVSTGSVLSAWLASLSSLGFLRTKIEQYPQFERKQ